MPARTDAEKLALIRRQMLDLQEISEQDPPAPMTREEHAHWEAVNMAYGFIARNVLSMIDHGTSRPPRTTQTKKD